MYRTLLKEAEITDRVSQLADEIYLPQDSELVVVPVLKGAEVFSSQLLLALGRQRAGLQTEIHHARVRTKDDTMQSVRKPKVELQFQPRQVAGRDVLLVEDIRTTNATFTALVTAFEQLKPSSLQVALLLQNGSNFTNHGVQTHVGFTIPEGFWVDGYGIDTAGKNRHLPYIQALLQDQEQHNRWREWRDARRPVVVETDEDPAFF